MDSIFSTSSKKRYSSELTFISGVTMSFAKSFFVELAVSGGGGARPELRLPLLLMSSLQPYPPIPLSSVLLGALLPLSDSLANAVTKFGVQGPVRFQDFSLEKLMHERSYSVFGRIEFFCVLRHLVISLAGCLHFP